MLRKKDKVMIGLVDLWKATARALEGSRRRGAAFLGVDFFKSTVP